MVSERIARLRIELQELEPKIWRRIDMPLSTTLEALHEAMQMTMGWTFSHLWEFQIDGRSYGDPSFREFDDEPVICKAKGLRLGTAIACGADRFVHFYDYGENWHHEVIVEEVRDGDPDMEYLERELARMMANMKPSRTDDAHGHLMKYGPDPNYLNEYILSADSGHRSEAIFLSGIPDIRQSVPHASAYR